MNNRVSGRAAAWRAALMQPTLWPRGLLIGLCVGSLQVIVNQGDAWWSGAVDARVLLKTALTPLITASVAVVSAAWEDVKQGRGDPADPRGGEVRNDREGYATSRTGGVGVASQG